MTRKQFSSRIFWKFTIRNFITRHHRRFHEWQSRRTDKRFAQHFAQPAKQLKLPLGHQS